MPDVPSDRYPVYWTLKEEKSAGLFDFRKNETAKIEKYNDEESKIKTNVGQGGPVNTADVLEQLKQMREQAEKQLEENLIAKMKLIPVKELIEDKKLLLVDDSIVRGTQLRETVEFLYGSGAKEVHMRSACPPIMYGCKFLNFSRATSDMELITRQTIMELEGKEGFNHLEEYADGNSERGKKMRKTICEKFGFASLGFQTIEGVVNAIGLDRCKLCTYCWNGKE